MSAFVSNRYVHHPWQPALLALGALVLLVASSWLIARDHEEQGGDWVLIEVGGKPLKVEVADTPELITRGLKYREQLGWNEGMLFVFPEPRILSFWMRDTRIDLDIGFFDGRGRLLNIERMEAFDDLTRHRSVRPAKYALEVNRGWFAAHGVSGDTSLRIRDAPRAQ
jgi:uncharacterized membrane protein (UPF0127 family)